VGVNLNCIEVMLYWREEMHKFATKHEANTYSVDPTDIYDVA
jgi:hypothetical protein